MSCHETKQINIGLPGEQGPRGYPGKKGSKGIQGETGPPGPSGEAGPTGLCGPVGAQGMTGEDGPTGESGATGARGATGEDGVTGALGATGATGASGGVSSPGIFYANIAVTTQAAQLLPIFTKLFDNTDPTGAYGFFVDLAAKSAFPSTDANYYLLRAVFEWDGVNITQTVPTVNEGQPGGAGFTNLNYVVGPGGLLQLECGDSGQVVSWAGRYFYNIAPK